MPTDMQQEVREIVLNNWAEWSLSYLWQCGHHPDELTSVASSLRQVLGQWWDARNTFNTADDPPQFFEDGKQWNVFWKPSAAQATAHDEGTERKVWQEGYDQGWRDAMLEVARMQNARMPNLCERMAAFFKGKRHD